MPDFDADDFVVCVYRVSSGEKYYLMLLFPRFFFLFFSEEEEREVDENEDL